MWHHDSARKVVAATGGAVPGGRAVILDARTLTRPKGGVFFSQARRFLETSDRRDALFGNAPVIFHRTSGEYHVTGTAHPLEHYLRQYEASLPPDELALPPQTRRRTSEL